MFVLSNCTEGRRNILCCVNQHWEGKSVYKPGTSKLQQPGRLPPSSDLWDDVSLGSQETQVAEGSRSQQGSEEVHQATCHPQELLPSLCISHSGNVGYEQSFPGIPTMPLLCPIACPRVLLELWSLSSTPHKLCLSQRKKVTAASPFWGLGSGVGGVVWEHSNSSHTLAQ